LSNTADNPSVAVDRTTLIIVALTAFWVLLFETVFFQVIIFVKNYMNACQVISMALLGIGLGGMLAAVVPRKRTHIVSIVGAWLLPLSVFYSMATIADVPSRIWMIELSLVPPFLLGSLIISIQLTLHPCHRVYFADLVGAALGVLVTTLVLPLLREEGCALLLVAIGAYIALRLTSYKKEAGRGMLAVNIILGLIAGIAVGGMLANLSIDWLNMAKLIDRNTNDSGKLYSIYQQKKKAGTLDSYKYKMGLGSLIERIDVIDIGSRRVVFFNAYANDHFTRALPSSHRKDRRLPVGLMHVMDDDQKASRSLIRAATDSGGSFGSRIESIVSHFSERIGEAADPAEVLYEPKDVMIVGPAAEGITKPAKLAAGETGSVVGVEINPACVKLMTGPYAGERSGFAYDGIDIKVMDARSYLARTDRKFDMITMLNTHRIRTVGDVGPPEYLHSYEAFSSYFDHLKDSGVIVLEERELTDKAQLGTARIIITAAEVLKSHVGAADPARHIIVYNWRAGRRRSGSLYVSLLIKKTPFTNEELDWLRKWGGIQKERERRLYWAAFPGMDLPELYEPASIYDLAAQGGGVEEKAGSDTFNMSVIRDDNPFPYDVYLARDHHYKVIKRVITFALVLGVLPALVLGAGLFGRRLVKRPLYSIWWLGYAIVLGFGYLLTEIVLIQRFQIYLSSPIWAVLIVLGVMLFSSGLGSLRGGHWTRGKAVIPFAAILALLALMALVLPAILGATIFLPLVLRIVIATILVGTLGFFMGMPLPICLNRLAAQSGPRLSAMAFGLNGSAGAVATSVALLTNKLYGFSGTFAIAAAAYGLALLMMLAVGFGRDKEPAPAQDVPAPAEVSPV